MTGLLDISSNSRVQDHELRHTAEIERLRRAGADAECSTRQSRLVIRAAGPGDEAAVKRLAQRDSRPLRHASTVLLAELDGELLAALPLDGGDAVADPFHPTVELVGLLKLRAAQLRGESTEDGRLKRFWSTLWRATSRPAMAPLVGDVSMPARHDGE
jgi:hypothetical protein